MIHISYEKGVSINEARDWDDFLTFVTKQLEYRHFIWRGQRDEKWLLEPTLDRKLPALKKMKRLYINDLHLKRFKYATRGRRGLNPREISNENEWWALGQHHGLATPLLDWTYSPFVAAFFAYIEKENSSTGFRVVFGISKTTIEIKSQEITDKYSGSGRPPIIEFVEPLTDDNPHLVNQAGLFSRTPSGVDIETWVKDNFKHDNKKIRLWKIMLPEAKREVALKSLNRMNINHLSLFPDIYGASSYVNLDLEIDKY